MDSPAVVTPPQVGRPLGLRPFPALRLAASRVGDPASGRLFARPYRDVVTRLRTWEERGFITRDEEPALYLHEYTADGTTVRGLVGALDVSRRAWRPEDRAVLPHEGIYPAQADELALRMAEMALNPAPILLVQRSPEPLREVVREVRARLPEHQFVDRAGNAHRLWVVRDPTLHDRVEVALAASTVLIADGHHRYAAYLRLHQRSPGPHTGAGLAMIVDQSTTPLLLGAIHRVLGGTTLRDLEEAAHLFGLPTEPLGPDVAVDLSDPHALVATDTERWLRISLPHDGHAAVEVLHDHLVPALSFGPERIGYHHTVADALRHAGPDTGVATLLPAPSLDRVVELARDDRLLPEKATSFQPKPPFGVLMRPLDEPGGRR